MSEQRRSKRKALETQVEVVDAMTGQRMGRIGNLSIDGMLLLATQPVRNDALYQLAFTLPDGHGGGTVMELGVHEQWNEPAGPAGHNWAGFRIIDISPRDFAALKQFIEEDAVA